MKIALMILLIAVGVVAIAAERRLRAVRNYDARLPCGQGKIFLDGPDAYVLWLKDDEKFLYRFPNEDTYAKTLNPNNIYGTSCVDENHCYDDTALFLPKVSDQDAGKYRCRVHYQASSSVDYVIDLRIVDPTGTPKIYDESGAQIVTPYVGPLTLGSNLTLICEVTISDPPTTVLWLRNGVAVRRVVSDQPGLLRERIQVVDALRDELDAHYQCSASNADVTEALAASVVVKMYLPPMQVEIRMNNNFDFEVGQPRVVDCVVVGCVPTPTINWYIGGKLLKASAHKELHDGNYTVSSLTLTASMRDNKQYLSCRVHNAYLPTVYEDNVTLNVGFRPTCIFHNAKVGIVLGRPVTIMCQIMSSEPPIETLWTFPDGHVKQGSITRLPTPYLYSSSLSWIAGDADLGPFSCRAINRFGQQRGHCILVAVEGSAPPPPACRPWAEERRETAELILDYLNCNRQEDHSGDKEMVHLHILDDNGQIVHTDSNPHGNFTIPSFPDVQNLTALVYAENSFGNSTLTIVPLNQTRTNEADNGHSKLGSVIGIVGGVILVTVCAGTLCCARRRKRDGPGGLFHREPDFTREARLQGTPVHCQPDVCQNAYCHTPCRELDDSQEPGKSFAAGPAKTASTACEATPCWDPTHSCLPTEPCDPTRPCKPMCTLDPALSWDPSKPCEASPADQRRHLTHPKDTTNTCYPTLLGHPMSTSDPPCDQMLAWALTSPRESPSWTSLLPTGTASGCYPRHPRPPTPPRGSTLAGPGATALPCAATSPSATLPRRCTLPMGRSSSPTPCAPSEPTAGALGPGLQLHRAPVSSAPWLTSSHVEATIGRTTATPSRTDTTSCRGAAGREAATGSPAGAARPARGAAWAAAGAASSSAASTGPARNLATTHLLTGSGPANKSQPSNSSRNGHSAHSGFSGDEMRSPETRLHLTESHMPDTSLNRAETSLETTKSGGTKTSLDQSIKRNGATSQTAMISHPTEMWTHQTPRADITTDTAVAGMPTCGSFSYFV